jgi:hypothetical protein
MAAMIDLHFVDKTGKTADIGNKYESFVVHRWIIKITEKKNG